MGFTKSIRLGLIISIIVWTVLLALIQLRQSWIEPAIAFPLSQSLYLWSIGIGLILFMISIIWLSKNLPFKWLISLGLNFLIGIAIIFLLQNYLTKNISHKTKLEPIIEQETIIEENGIKERITSLNQAEVKVSYDLWLIYLLVLGIVYTVIGLLELNRQQLREVQLQEQMSRTRLNALRQQLNPHFLFNALNTVSALIDQNKKEAQQVLEDISLLLRGLLDNSEQEMISLEQEIIFLKKYVEIEQKRFGEGLKIQFIIPEETLAGKVPAMLLQPLLENAIKHGILGHYNFAERNAGKGEIIISSDLMSNRLHLFIKDNGPGLPHGDFTKRIGLRNTQERLESNYSNDFKLIFKNGKNGGLQVSIDLPFST